MTIEELKAKMPWIDVTEWIVHPNGGGWKHKTAIVPDAVEVPSDASIGYRASIGYGVSIGDGVSIGYRASIGDGVSIGYDASIGYGVSIGDGASIGANHKGSILCIQASPHHLTVCCPTDEVQIGCHRRPIADWLKGYMAIGKKEKYTEAQIVEYGILLGAVDAWIKLQPKPEAKTEATNG